MIVVCTKSEHEAFMQGREYEVSLNSKIVGDDRRTYMYNKDTNTVPFIEKTSVEFKRR